MAKPTLPLPLLRALIFGVLALIACRRAWELLMQKAFTLDEFQWAHAAWELARGQVQYRDFFEVHFPFTYQYMSLAFRFGGDDPTTILTMRMMMVPVLLFMAWGMWRINEKDGKSWAILAPLLAFSLPSWLARATEIRHDPCGFALFIGAVACLYLRRPPLKVRSLIAGSLLALACWTTQKVLIYGVVFFGAIVADLFVNRRKGRECMLGDPIFFLIGSAMVVAAISLRLYLDENWEPFYQWCFAWAADYQRKYPGFSWFSKLMPMLRDLWWYFALAGIGFASTLRRLREDKQPHNPDQLLLAAWVSTWASWGLQQAPWSYSAIPFLGVTCILAARGAARIFAWIDELQGEGSASSLFFSTALGLLFLAAFTRAGTVLEKETQTKDRYDLVALEERYFDDEEQNLQGLPDSGEGLEFEDPADDPEREEKAKTKADEDDKWLRFFERPDWAQLSEPQNEYQLRVLAKIGELTNPDDTIYDNTGTFVARPHAYFFYYTFASIWNFHEEMLKTEVPEALEDSQAVMVLIDSRYRSLPKSLKRYIKRHYQPYNGDMWIAGMSFDATDKSEKPDGYPGKFFAVTKGEYFVYPPDALDSGTLRIDGKTVANPYFKLKAGKHAFVYKGPQRAFSILWRPRNGELWHPNRAAKAHFCCRRTTG